VVWKSFFSRQEPPRGLTANVPAVSQAERDTEPRQLLHAHRQRLVTLRLESGYPPETFENLFGALALAVAEHVHLLPATRAENHAEPGGLLRFALECACSAFRRADGQFLSGVMSTDVRNRERDRVWRYVTFVGALLRPLGRALTDVRVSCNQSRDGVWDSYQEPLWGWMRRVDATQLQIDWQRNDTAPTQAASIWLAARVLTPAALSYLHGAEGVNQILLQLLAGEPAGRIGDLVEQAYQGAIDDDLARIGQRHDLAVTGVQIEHRLLEALRGLVREKWTLNTAGGRLWFTHEGVYLSWKAAVNDLTVRLRAEGVNNAPRDPDTIAELLTQHGVLAPNPQATNGLKHYYRITPQLRGAPKQSIEAVKLKDIELIGLHLDGVDAIDAHAPPEGAKDAAAPNGAKPFRKSDQHSLELPWEGEFPTRNAPAQARLRAAAPAPAAARATPAATPAAAAPVSVSSATPAAATPPAVVDTPPPKAEVSEPAPAAAEPAPAFALTPTSAPAPEKKSADLNRLNRFGEAGQVLKALAERLLSEPEFTRLVSLKEGVALAYPQAIAPFCPQPQRFLSDCEAQGLLVDPSGGRRLVHTRGANDAHLPEQYLVLSPRIAKCLPAPSGS
jgi:hypothetical protein